MRSRAFIFLFLIVAVSPSPVNALEIRGNTVLRYTEGPVPEDIQLFDNSTLIITGVYPETTLYNDTQDLKLDVYDNSSVIMTNSNFQGIINLYNRTSLEMVDSSVFDARWCGIHRDFHNGSLIRAYDSSNLMISSSKVGYLRGYDDISAIITGSSVMEIGSYVNRGEAFDVQFQVTDSSVGRIHLYNVNATLDGIRAGFYDHIVFDQVPGQIITLDDSTLKRGITVTNYNTSMSITNSDLYVVSAYDGSPVKISKSYIWSLQLSESPEISKLDGCQIDYMNLHHEHEVTVEANNCDIGRFSTFKYHILIASNTTIHDYYQGRTAKMVLNRSNINLRNPAIYQLDINGEFNLENNSLPEFRNWGSNITINRLFPLTVTKNNVPVKEAHIQVMKDKQAIRYLTTDSDGYTEFSLVFANHHSFKETPPVVFFNLTDQYTLLVTLPDTHQNQTIDVYTKTPINIHLEVRTHENILLFIASIAILMIIFYTRYGVGSI